MDEAYPRRVSVREIVKVFGENQRPIFLPKTAVVSEITPISTIDENSISEDSFTTDEDSAEDKDISTTDEDELSDRNEIDGYLNQPEIVDQVTKFLQEEERYCHLLEELVKDYIKTLQSHKLNILDVFGRIDLISSHHSNTFLPALQNSRNVLDIANCFVKNRKLFSNYYDSYFKNQPNMIFVMLENKNLFTAHQTPNVYKQHEETLQKAPGERIQSYQMFLETIRDILADRCDVGSFNRSLVMIEKLTKQYSKKEETVRFNISEIVETERLYIEKLERITQKMIPKIKNTIRGKRRHTSIVGNVPSIYINQVAFYDDLKKCLYEFNPNEVADCFLKNRNNFMLYIEDQQMKNDPRAIEECKQVLKQDDQKDMDFHAPLNRLYKYKLLLKELKKSCDKSSIPSNKVEKAYEMVSEIISQMDGTAAVNSIIDENIHLYEQGKLILRGEFDVQYKMHEHDRPVEYNSMVYLFEKSIVFTEKTTEGNSRNRRDVFIYKNHIIAKHLGIVTNDSLERIIQIHFYGRSKKHFFTLQAKDKATKDVWMKEIENILMKQLLDEKENNV